MKNIKKLKKLSKSFREHIGPHQIEIPKSKHWQDISGTQPVFIFDFFAIEKSLRYSITSYVSELCKVNLTSLDISWIQGQNEFLKDGLLSFWFWDKNHLIPFAFVGKEAHNGPFHPIEGVLFLSTTKEKKWEDMEVLLLTAKEDAVITKVASSFDELSILKRNPDLEQSEQIKQEGNVLFGAGDFEGAAEKFYEAMIVDPTNPNPYNNMGMITQVAKIMPKRGEFFAQLSYLVDSEYTNGMRGYSGYPATRGNFKKSIKLIKKCIEIEPSAQNYGILTKYYFVAKKYNEAREAGEEALQLDPNHPDVLDIMAKIPL
ncbi:tetratricopeptide repeat protein [Aquimarina sp. SS2-1]|uniref:tetratricopeptide repeat protein n=1 Tax=Aquimarina besae TaxID=3342247 RepID=UPI00366CACEE